MALGKRLINTGSEAACNTDSVQPFGADSTYSSNIAVYQLDGNDDDTTGNYNGTSDTDVTYSSTGAKFGQAASFNGSSSHITTSLDFDTLTNYTISIWIKPSASGKYFAGTVASSTALNGIYLYIESGNAIRFFERNGSNSATSLTSTDTVTLNAWNHIVAVRDGSTNYIYVNNGTPVSLSNNSISHTSDFTMGRAGAFTSSYFDGSIDEVRVFNKALSAEDISTLYAETSSTASNTNPLSEGAGVALYSLDYDASEASGYYDGTPTDVTFGVDGKINYGARFNGSSSGITVNSFASLSQLGLSMWVKIADVTSNYTLAARYGTNREFAIYNYQASNGFIASIYYNGNNGNAIIITAGDYLTNNTWHHIAFTSDGSTAPKLYIDGVERGTAQFSDTTRCAYYTSTEPLEIGKGVSRFLNGDIDQVRIFNKALSSDEVSTLWNSGNGETACVHTATTTDVDYPTTNLAYYKLDNSAEDEKGSYDGTESNIEYRFGRFGQALKYSASTSSTITTGITESNIPTNFTVSFWSKLDSPNNFQAFVGLYSKSPISNQGWSFFSRNTSGSIYRFSWLWYYDTSQNYNYVDANNEDIIAGNWYHIALSFTSGSLPILYVNGVASNTYYSSTTTAPVYNSGAVFQIGNTPNTNVQAGSVDQLRFFSSALSSSQITQLYNEKPETDTSNFKAVLYEGNSSANHYISNVGFQPDLVWIKARNGAINHYLNDSVTPGSYLQPNSTAVDTTSTAFPSFDANGFTLNSSNLGNNSSYNYVAWTWKGGGDAVQNNDGTINGANCMVSANTAAGFSIVKYTGNGTDGATVGHGLSSAPEIIIIKNLDSSSANWLVKVPSIMTDDRDFIYLNDTSAISTAGSTTFIKTVNSSIFTLGTSSQTNSTDDFIAYCWHSVAEYSKVATYTGATSGVTVSDVGFAPSFVLIKSTSHTDYWGIFDDKRPSGTGNRSYLYPNTSDDEDIYSGSLSGVTLTSTGFAIDNTNSNMVNKDGETYIYMAFK